MASIELRGKGFRIVFRYGGQRFSRSLHTKDRKAAKACLARLEDNLRRMELGLLQPPEDDDLTTFLLSDGRASNRPPKLRGTVRTLGALLDGYMASITSGSMEDTTLAGMRIHVRRLKRGFGAALAIGDCTLDHLQTYVEKRSRDKGIRGRRLSTATIKKELRTLTTAWSWGLNSGALSKPLPKRGLRFPKTVEKPPFQTWEEIERRIARGDLPAAEQAELWDCVFLTLSDIDNVLKHVWEHARQPFIYPMFVFAAHTGARRSELIRSEIDDIDFDGATVQIREKKRIRGKLSMRRVPLSQHLLKVLRDWISLHPGGRYTFALGAEIPRSRKTRSVGMQLTRDEAHDHFKRPLADSKWKNIRGWHVFRHSFCSNCAAKGVDQRVINAWVGHQTEEMVRRYRHLIPNQQQKAIQQVFGEALRQNVQIAREGVGA